MKKTIKLITLILVFAICASILGAAPDARASYNISSYDVYVEPLSSSRLRIHFWIEATGKMSMAGSPQILVFHSNGSVVMTYKGTTSNGMLKSNADYASGYVTFTGNPGTTYYAMVTVAAQSGSGCDSRGVFTKEYTV